MLETWFGTPSSHGADQHKGPNHIRYATILAEDLRTVVRMDSLQERARRRATTSGTGIGAAFERDVSPNDLDGTRWLMRVSDGKSDARLEVQVSGSEPILDWEIPVLTVERVVERIAGRFRAECRLDEMAAQKRISLHSDDFPDQDFAPEAP